MKEGRHDDQGRANQCLPPHVQPASSMKIDRHTWANKRLCGDCPIIPVSYPTIDAFTLKFKMKTTPIERINSRMTAPQHKDNRYETESTACSVKMLEEPIEILGCHGTGSCVVIVIACNGGMEEWVRGDNVKFKCMHCLLAQTNDRDLSKDWPQRHVLSFGHG